MAQATIRVSLTEPNWQFLLDSRPIEQTSAQLTSSEREFSQRIKPLLAENQYAEAAQAFSLRELANDSPALQQLRGQVLLKLKRFDQAEQALQAAVTSMPNLALGHRSLSMLYMLKKDYEKASAHLTRSINLGVADAQLYGQLAFINLNNHHAASAIIGYQQALFLQPTNTQWQQGLLYAWLNSHNFAAAQQLVDDMLAQQQHPNPTELWLLRSQIALQMQQPQQALTNLEIALHLPSKSQDTRVIEKSIQNKLLAAKLHVQHGSLQRAVTLLEESLQRVSASNVKDAMSPQAKNEVLAALDQILPWLFNQDKGEKASGLLKIAETMHIAQRHQAKLNLYRGQLALQQKQNKLAIGYLKNAVKQDPTLGKALFVLAKAYQQQSNLPLAERYFVRASALPTIKIQALLANAQLQIQQKKYSQALALLQQVLVLDPQRRDIRHNVQELQKIVRQEQYVS